MRLWHIIFYIYPIDIHITVFLLSFFIYVQRLVQTITEKTIYGSDVIVHLILRVPLQCLQYFL